MMSVRRLSKPTALHSKWQPDLLCCMGRPVVGVDSNCGIEELKDAGADALDKILCEVRSDVPQPVVSQELETPCRQNP